jgi:REP element-mobilizing transposase RayT
MDRIWFLTWHTYGTWLPGDRRGYVSPIVDDEGKRIVLNALESEAAWDNERLRQHAKAIMKGDPILLTREMTENLADQFHETARFRGWRLLGFAILCTHVHLVVGAPGDPDPEKLLGDFKAYGSRKLNSIYGKPTNGTWWVDSGSKRKLKGEAAAIATLRYVCWEQETPLLMWIDSEWKPLLGKQPASSRCEAAGSETLQVS